MLFRAEGNGTIAHSPAAHEKPAVSGSLRASGVQKYSSYPSFHFVDTVFISVCNLKYVPTNIQLDVMECCTFRQKVHFSKRTHFSVLYCAYLAMAQIIFVKVCDVVKKWVFKFANLTAETLRHLLFVLFWWH
jgi:hypothetical protein